MIKDVASLQENANMWCISDDFWDDWKARRMARCGHAAAGTHRHSRGTG
jgi:hypothetical protein